MWVSCAAQQKFSTIFNWGKPGGVTTAFNLLYDRSFNVFWVVTGSDYDVLWMFGNSLQPGSAADKVYNFPALGDPFCDGTWRHIALVYNADTVHLELYLNGRRYGTSGAFHPEHYAMGGSPIVLATPSPSRLCFGVPLYTDLSHPFNGALSDVRVYSRALRAAELVQIALRNTTWACPPGPYYRLPGSASCGLCVNGAVPVADGHTCRPSVALGPADTVFYHSCDKAEGFGAFSYSPPGQMLYPNFNVQPSSAALLSWTTDRFGSPNAALLMAQGASLASPEPLPVLPAGAMTTLSRCGSCATQISTASLRGRAGCFS
jgi:hypothetical protein